VFAGDARPSYDVVETFNLSSLSNFNNSYCYLLITVRSVVGRGGKRRAVFGGGRRRWKPPPLVDDGTMADSPPGGGGGAFELLWDRSCHRGRCSANQRFDGSGDDET